MIAKETFVKIIASIKEQEEINERVADALHLVCNGNFVFGTENKEHEALLLLLRLVFKDNEDYIGWWLYDTSEHNVWTIEEGIRKEHNLADPESLYDFLINNMKEGV